MSFLDEGIQHGKLLNQVGVSIAYLTAVSGQREGAARIGAALLCFVCGLDCCTGVCRSSSACGSRWESERCGHEGWGWLGVSRRCECGHGGRGWLGVSRRWECGHGGRGRGWFGDRSHRAHEAERNTECKADEL